jgi:hypothetical protein
MAEPNRIPDEKITTADLLARTEKYRETEGRSSLLQNERHADVGPPSAFRRLRSEDVIDPSEKSTPPDGVAIPLTSGDAGVGTQTPIAQDMQSAPLFADGEIGKFRSRWSDIQAGFVDSPRQAVEDADNLVASLMKKLAEGFASERDGLEKQWDRGDKVSTEDLRVALQRYRSFFDRLLRV